MIKIRPTIFAFTMNRRPAFFLFLSLVFVSGLGADERPNIILFVSDDHGMDAMGAYGNPVIQTPHMDQLAKEGVRFDQAYCTSASCAASRSVILTGLYGHATGSYGHVHNYHHFRTFDDVVSLPVRLAKAGYRTARVGKYHVAPEAVYHFETVLDANPRSTVEMAEVSEKVIEGDAPFFLYFCPDDPHRGPPYSQEDWTRPNSFGNRPEGYPGVETITYDPDDVLVPDFLPDNKYTREEIAEYYQSVSRIDQGLGRLRELVAAAGKTDNTIIIYLSDNGMAFPGAKTTVYEPGIRLPLLVVDPRSEARGVVNDAMVTWADLTPTIMDFTGAPIAPKEIHGRSFRSILGATPAEGWDEIYAAHTFHEITMYYPMRVVRSGDLKLIWNIAHGLPYPFASDLWAASTWQGIYQTQGEHFGQRTVKDYLYRAEFELYDLAVDPGELNNLAADPDHADALENLKAKLQDFQLKTRDPWQIIWGNQSQLQGTGVNL
ncbi:MAG: sulfatase [Synoicihabitans sp.]